MFYVQAQKYILISYISLNFSKFETKITTTLISMLVCFFFNPIFFLKQSKLVYIN